MIERKKESKISSICTSTSRRSKFVDNQIPNLAWVSIIVIAMAAKLLSYFRYNNYLTTTVLIYLRT